MKNIQPLNYDIIKNEWQLLINNTNTATHQILMNLSDQEVWQLVDAYYQYMLQDEKAKLFLSTAQVEERLSASMNNWLRKVLGSSCEDLSELITHQRNVGEVHARIGLPIDLVARGARKLKYELFQLLLNKPLLSEKEISDAIFFSGMAIDSAIEVMTVAFTPSHQKMMHDQEHFRLLTVYDDMSVERERQLGALKDWENQFIYNIATELPFEERVLLSDSEFGLWFSHKGQHIFRQPDLIKKIDSLIQKIDRLITTEFANESSNTFSRIHLLRLLRQDIEQVNMILSSIFEEIVKSENGKDPMTKLLTRRFIPTIMRREIALSISSGKPFTIALLDIDYFKKINDNYGHAVGDSTLKSIAVWLHEYARSSDYVFRYGGEEFMLLLVETTLSQAQLLTERLRNYIASQKIEVDVDTSFNVTISAGLVEFDNHPDYQRLINKADKMLYQAKNNGRNCIESYPFGMDNSL
ncbi:putative heme-regulated two-component response regulator [Buttiauxella noackiae ATCC 51607]|uniref:Diguanylate cyclase DosC n=1 Tax=Buttiauxella noackiae ATCC 51607 TaxID=1354255 RepID=A0A1B7I0I7_9ENTR|nr:diguanylate cyclase [Buttiauxella noackiae]OAT21559.1 putative heme-regulated two-component response regulator [Buttiauxella noackiae ATCC 51607]